VKEAEAEKTKEEKFKGKEGGKFQRSFFSFFSF